MSRIRGKNTIPEIVVRQLLHRMGFRFRLHAPKLPGKPDIVLTKYRVAIFVHGCFWHQHRGCRNCAHPKSNKAFWNEKLSGNIRRDRQNRRKLTLAGWKSVVIWECETESPRFEQTLTKRVKFLIPAKQSLNEKSSA